MNQMILPIRPQPMCAIAAAACTVSVFFGTAFANDGVASETIVTETTEAAAADRMFRIDVYRPSKHDWDELVERSREGSISLPEPAWRERTQTIVIDPDGVGALKHIHTVLENSNEAAAKPTDSVD